MFIANTENHARYPVDACTCMCLRRGIVLCSSWKFHSSLDCTLSSMCTSWLQIANMYFKGPLILTEQYAKICLHQLHK